MAPVVDLPLNPQVPHAISSLRVYPRSTLTALKKKNSISFEQNSAKFHAFFMRISNDSKDGILLFNLGAKEPKPWFVLAGT
jgi:hypothetical protein